MKGNQTPFSISFRFVTQSSDQYFYIVIWQEKPEGLVNTLQV